MNTPKVLQKFWALSLVILLAGFIGIGQTSAQNYFVDAVAGNDASNGSQMAVGGFPNGPFKTIAAATAAAIDGSTVTILANTYAETVSTTEAITFAVQTSGSNTVVTINDITHNSPGDTVTYTDAAGGGVGTFSLTGGIMLSAGTVNFGTAVVVATGQTITRTLGSLTGTAPTTTNVDVIYDGVLSGGMMAGNELPASLGSGSLYLGHTSAALTIPNAVSVNNVYSASTGNVYFLSTLTTTGDFPTDVHITANNIFTVSGTATIAGGIDIDAAATISMGATSVTFPVDNNGGAATFASLDLNNSHLINTSGTIVVTGDLTVGVEMVANLAQSGVRVWVGGGTVTVGSLTADPLVDTSADENDVIYTIDNDDTFTVIGAITEGTMVETASGDTEYSAFQIENANGQRFSIGASSTIRGNIDNDERDATSDGDGIILNNNATLTVQDALGSGNLSSIGDIVGGTLVLNYANAQDDAGDVNNGQSLTLVNNLTFGADTATLAAPADDLDVNIVVGGNLNLNAAVTYPYNFTVAGTVFLGANVTIDGHLDATPITAGGTQTWNGFDAGAFAAVIGTFGAADAVVITGTQADFNDSVVHGVVTATAGPGAVTATDGASFVGITSGSIALSGTGQVDVDGPIDVSGNVSIPAGMELEQTLPGASDIDGTLDISGTYQITTGAGSLSVDGNVTIDATGTLDTTDASDLNFAADFTGGTFANADDDDVVFNTPSGGSTIAFKPGTTLNTLTVNGANRTATFTESVTVDSGVTLGDDTIVDLQENSLILSGGDLLLTDDASVTNTGSNGSVQFTGNATQVINVTGTPTTNPTLKNLFINNSGGAPAVNVVDALNISGTLTIIDGVFQADAVTVTFTGSSSKIAYSPESIDPIAVSGIGAYAGTRDIEYIGSLSATRYAGAEYTATNIRNLTVSTTGNIPLVFPAIAATISGNLVVSNTTMVLNHDLTVTGNATISANTFASEMGVDAVFEVAGAMSVADETYIYAGANGTMEVVLSGNSQTHTLAGELGARTTVRVQGTNTIVNGAVAGDLDGDSELLNLIVDAGADVTFNTLQVINGTVTVNGTATLNMVTDDANAGGGSDTNDGVIAGAINVNDGGSLTVGTTSTNVTLAFPTAVDDGATFKAASDLTAVSQITIGDGTQTTPATFNLNGFIVVSNSTAPSVVVNASSAPATAPSFGASGTLSIPTGGGLDGNTNATIPNLVLSGGGALLVGGGSADEISTDVTVSNTFTVMAASTGGDGYNVTVLGAAQINGDYTGTAGSAGSRLIMAGTASTLSTTKTTLTITNLGVASSASTTLAKSGSGNTVLSVNYLDHDSGLLDITDEDLTLIGNGTTDDVDWEHDGGTYAGTGQFIIAEAGAFNVGLSTAGADISVPKLAVFGAAGDGLKLGNAGDGITVTGQLDLYGDGGNVELDNGAAGVATFTMGNGSTIVRATGSAVDHFDSAPTLGTGMTVRYTYQGATAITTANELPTTLLRLEYEGDGTAGDYLGLADGVSVTVDQLETSGNIQIDINDSGASINITDGGRIEYDGAAANFTEGTPVPAGAITYRWDVTDATSDLLWPDVQTGATVSVTNGTLTLHESRTAGVLVAGDGIGAMSSAMLYLGVNTLTVSGATTIDYDGNVYGGTLNADGVVTNGGILSSDVVASKDLTLTGSIGSLTLDGTTAQTVTVPADGTYFDTLVVNNAAGATFAGMTSGSAVLVGAQTITSSIVSAVAAGLTLTDGVLTIPDGNVLLLPHGGSGLQGYTRTSGCVFGNIRKQLSNTTSTAPADRMDFPLCSQGGLYRPYAVTFNNPNTIGGVAPTVAPATTDASPAITVRHDVSGENSVAELSGTNGLAQTVNGVSIARYPHAPSFFWTVSPSFTMSPSLSYDVDMRANDYANFSSSCGASACDINEIYPVRRHVGSTSNLWSVASSTTDNFLAGDNDPVVIGLSATGALQSSGTVFTYGLKSIFAAATSPAAITVSTGNAHVVDLSTYFTGFTGALTYTAVSSDNSDATNPTTANVAGNNLTVTGGATAGAAVVSVSATDSFGLSATVSFTANNSAALTASTDDLNRTLNVAGTSTQTFAGAFSGGAGTVAYTAASSDAAVTVASDGTTVTITAATVGNATITLTGTDGSTTPVVATKTFTVTVNTAFAVTNVASTDVLEGANTVVDLATAFAGGTAPYVYGAPVSATANVTATIVGSNLTATVADAYTAGTTVGTVDVTVVGTDAQGDVQTFTLTVNVLPVKGDLDGQGMPSANSATVTLKHIVGSLAPVLTDKQLVAADFDSNQQINSFDAFQIWLWPVALKAGAAEELVGSSLAFGEMGREGTLVSLPIMIEGPVSDVVAMSFATSIDPAFAKVVSIDNNAEGWMLQHAISEDGEIQIAAIGLDAPENGVVATINIQLNDAIAQFSISGEGALNNNPISSIDAIEVVELPGTFALQGNYPNPFNPSTTIQFDLPETADVEIQVIDMVGRRVMTVPSQTMQAGVSRSIQLNASALASGAYFYRVIAKMESKTAVDSGRFTLIK